MPRFEPGNKLAKGGARPGSGPKGLTKKQILEAASQIKVLADHGDGEGPRSTQIGLACFMELARLAMGDFEADGAERDEETGESIGDTGCDKARIQIAAINQILNRLIGRPQIAVELSGSLGLNLQAAIAAASEPRARKIVAEVSAMAPPLPSPPRGARPQLSQRSVAVPGDGDRRREGPGGKPRAKGKAPRKG